MKRTIFISLLILLNISSFGQKIRFSDTTNRWKVLFMSGWPIEYDNTYGRYTGDTTVNGINYQIFSESVWTPSSLCLVREDTLLSEVFVKLIANNSGTDTTEEVLYNYNWHIGDTIIRSTSGDYFIHVVSSIDSTLINSNWYRVWHFQLINSSIASKDYDIIEGIGCTDNPFFSLSPMDFEAATRLLCFSNSNGTPIVNPKVGEFFDNDTSCSSVFNSGIKSIFNKNESVITSPNPITESSKIIIPYNISSGTLVIVNDVGQEVINIPFQNKEELLIGDKIKVPGICCYRVTDDVTGAAFSGKFVHE